MSVNDICSLCSIPKRETILFENDLIYLVQTNNLKGHKVRVMVCTKQHTSNPTPEEQKQAIAVLTNYMTSFMNEHDWFIVGNENASIKTHAHWIACDEPIEDEEDPLFNKTSKIHFPLKEKKILIGLPAYNEEKTLPPILAEARKYGDIVVVNDGSTDSTKSVLQFAQVDTITHSDNLGYGSSIHDLFRKAKKENYDILITLDSDGQHDASEIPQFLEGLKTADIAIGNRFLSKSNTPSYRKLGIKTISKLSGIGDAQCGFRAYNKRAISAISDNIYEKGMGASVEILKIAQASNFKIAEVPCTIRYGKEDHSQNPLSHGLDVLRSLFWSTIWENPLKSLLPLALIFLLMTIIAGLQTANLYIQFHSIVLSWALLAIGSTICTMLIFNILIFILIFKNKKG